MFFDFSFKLVFLKETIKSGFLKCVCFTAVFFMGVAAGFGASVLLLVGGIQGAGNPPRTVGSSVPLHISVILVV